MGRAQGGDESAHSSRGYRNLRLRRRAIFPAVKFKDASAALRLAWSDFDHLRRKFVGRAGYESVRHALELGSRPFWPVSRMLPKQMVRRRMPALRR